MTCFIRYLALVCGLAASHLAGCGDSGFSAAAEGGAANDTHSGGARTTISRNVAGYAAAYALGGSGRAGTADMSAVLPANGGTAAEPGQGCVDLPSCGAGDPEVVGACPSDSCYELCGTGVLCQVSSTD
jgi:hypothetical protein